MNAQEILLPVQDQSLSLLRKKYAHGDENSIEEVQQRVAAGLAANEVDQAGWTETFRRALRDVIPAGRIQSGIATGKQVTLMNCFVQPIGDSLTLPDEQAPGILVALANAGETMSRGGGVGYNFSAIRPAGALVRKKNARASGVLSYMRVYDAACATVVSAGERRGAQMGVLNCDHPEIEEFVRAKREPGVLTQFNVSVAVTDTFMDAVERDASWELVHEVRPHPDAGIDSHQRDCDGRWVYRTLRARELFELITQSTYDYAEPGIIFIDQVNRENPLSYAEYLDATNPCAEEPLPPYGCCCLGSVNLTQFVTRPFRDDASFDWERFRKSVGVLQRMLDNALDLSFYPLEEQCHEAMAKRRVGQGFLGLGSALIMLGIAYNTAAAREFAGAIAKEQMIAAYAASVELAKERGSFPLFDAEKYLASAFCKRLPPELRQAIAKHGIRNSHSGAIAPTGTISLTFADNASGGIEPVFAYEYERKVKQPDGSTRTIVVQDHAFRLYRHLFGETQPLTPAFVSTADLTVDDHLLMMAAVQPFVDASISKTVNVPREYAFAEFQALYFRAWKLGLKAVAAYRPSDVRGSVLSAIGTGASDPNSGNSTPQQRLTVKPATGVAIGSLRWHHRPNLPNGNPSHTYLVRSPDANFALSVGHVQNGTAHPFEVGVQWAEAPRGLDALAKLLSMDMRSVDREWLRAKLDMLSKTRDQPYATKLPGCDHDVVVPSVVSAVGQIVRHRCMELGFFGPEDAPSESPMLNAMTSHGEPRSVGYWSDATVTDIVNETTGDKFVVCIKEAELADGTRLPYSVWFAGEYPRQWDGLTRMLSYDMRVSDVAWIGAKLRLLVDQAELAGGPYAPSPENGRHQLQPSTLAYVAKMILARYVDLGLLDFEGNALRQTGLFERTTVDGDVTSRVDGVDPSGRQCPSCGNLSMIKQSGCDHCTHCDYIGSCG